MIFMESKTICQPARQKGDSHEYFTENIEHGGEEPEINDSEDRFDWRSQQLRAERDLNRNGKSKFD